MAQKAKQERTNLGFLGVTYQEKLVKAFFEDKKFFEEIIPIVDQNMFTDDALRTIVGGMKDCYQKMDSVPTYQTIDFWIRGRTPDQYKIDLYVARLERIGTQELDDLVIVKREAECFFKQQNLIKAVNKISGILRDGQTSRYAEAEDIIRHALELNMGQRNGQKVFDKIEETLSPDYRDTIPTGFDKLDVLLEGGLGKTELGVIIAPSGVGKAQPLYSRIATPSGYRTMGELQVGDQVIGGGDGEPHNVIAVFPQGLRPVYEVAFTNGMRCRCDIDHLWNVVRLDAHRAKSDTCEPWRTHAAKNASVWVLREILSTGLTYVDELGVSHPRFAIPMTNAATAQYQDMFFTAEELSKFNAIRSADVTYLLHGVATLDSQAEADRFMAYLQMHGVGAERSGTSVVRWMTHTDCIPIAAVEYIGQEETKCILIDSDDHLYLTEDFIVTHNTSATIGFAASAAVYKCEANNNHGYKVLHYFFEDNEKTVRRKYFAYTTDIEARNLSKPQFRERALEIINDPTNEYRKLIDSNIIFERLNSGEISVGEIKNKIRGHMNRGFIPDLVIIDYFECIKLESPDTRDEKDYNRESRTMRKLESLANEMNVALWVPIQGTKGSIGQEFVGMNDGGGSVSKVQIGHAILSFARTPDMANANKMNVAVHKFRGGAGNETIQDVIFNNGTCRFYPSDAANLDSIIGSSVQQQNINRLMVAQQMMSTARRTGV